MFPLIVLNFAVWCYIKRIYICVFMYFVTEGETLVIIIKAFEKKSQKQERASLN